MNKENSLNTIEIDEQETISPVSYRDAMSHFGAAVHIVTTKGVAGLRGVTISACCSLSDNPPTLLICVMKQHASNSLFIDNGHFCINTLAGEQQPLADIFAGRCGIDQTERFAGAGWTSLKTGSPVLENALAAFDCRLVCWYEHATHYILCGRVVDMRSCDAGNALMYLNRGYHKLPL